MLWLKFPSALPIALLMTVGLVGAVTFLVCETIVVLRIAKMLVPPGPLGREIRNMPVRSLVGLGVMLVLCNGAVLYFYELRPNLVYVLALNLAVVVSWARLAAARHVDRRDDRRST